MSTPEVVNSADFISDLGLIVGLEQGCSISAAEAYDTAHQIIGSGSRRNIYLAETPDIRTVGYSLDLRRTVQVEDQTCALSLIQPEDLKEKQIIKRGLLRKTVEATRVTSKSDPLLCVQIGEDSYLPIARFALESSSDHCSYVQLGDEMTDETVIMTALDEHTSRQEMVEAIRTVFDEYKQAKSENGTSARIRDKKGRSIIQMLVDQQVNRHQESLATAQEAMLVRRCIEKVSERTELKKLLVIADKDNHYTRDIHVSSVLSGCQLDQSRFLDFVLTKDTSGKKTDIKLMAVTRGKIAIPVASIISETGKVVFEAIPDKLDKNQRANLTQLLLDRIRSKPLVTFASATNKFEHDDAKSSALQKELKNRPRNQFGAVPISTDEYIRHGLNSYDRIAATYLYTKQGLLNSDEGACDPNCQGITKEGVDSTYKSLSELCADPEYFARKHPGEYKPFGCDGPPVWLALSRMPLIRQAEQNLFGQLGVAQKMREYLGESSLEEERFVKQVQELCNRGTVFHVTVNGVNTGTNRAAIDIKTQLSNQGTSYNIELYAKPSALKEQTFPDEPYKSLTFDLLQPITQKVPGSREEALKEVKKFANTLAKVADH
jgi:hypothetical protein